jgi:hypothetical protein
LCSLHSEEERQLHNFKMFGKEVRLLLTTPTLRIWEDFPEEVIINLIRWRMSRKET